MFPKKKSECDDSNIAAAVNKTSIYSKLNTIMYKSTEWLENMKLLFVLNVDEKNVNFFIVNFKKNQTKGHTSLRNISRSDIHLFQVGLKFDVV